MAIPPAATAIHGISTEQARRDGRPATEVLAEVTALLAQVWTAATPLCAFNAAFDLTMLDAELQRHDGRSLLVSGPVIDPLCIDHHLNPDRAGPRNLAAVCAHYQVRLDGAHTSAGDALAAARLAWRLARTQPEHIGRLAPHILHSHQVRWYRDWKLGIADKLDGKIRYLSAHGGDTDEVNRLRAHAADIRASVRSWPLLSLTTAGSQPVRRRLPPRPGGPANSHASWTPDQDADLRDEWLAADPTAVAATLRKDIATRLGRSLGEIRFRLLRLRCNPELPGHTCDEDQVAHLKQVYDAEYGRS